MDYRPESFFGNDSSLLMLHEFALLLNSTDNIGTIVLQSAAKIRKITQSDGCHIMFSQPVLDELKLETAILDAELPLDHIDLPKGQVAQETFATGQVIIINETAEDPRIIQSARELLGHHSMASIPLIVHGEIIGVMVVFSKQPHHYNYQDGQFLLMLGNHLGLAVENARLVVELKKAAMEDYLTGAYNHRYLRTLLGDLTAQSNDQALSLIMFDIDRFKAINDQYGHLAGDYVLQEVTNILRTSVLGSTDILARYGGDEFIIVLPGADEAQTVNRATNLEQSIAQHPFVFENFCFNVNISWGMVSLAAQAKKSALEIIKLADQKLYEMKNLKKRIRA